jgi:hypothetical protein
LRLPGRPLAGQVAIAVITVADTVSHPLGYRSATVQKQLTNPISEPSDAGLDEGFLSLCFPILVYMESNYRYNKCQ